MGSLQKLAQMGGGNEILQSVQDRGNLKASINNAKTFYKYVKNGVKGGLFSREQSKVYILGYYNKLKANEFLAQKYNALYSEDFYKIKLQIEKFYNNDI